MVEIPTVKFRWNSHSVGVNEERRGACSSCRLGYNLHWGRVIISRQQAQALHQARMYFVHFRYVSQTTWVGDSWETWEEESTKRAWAKLLGYNGYYTTYMARARRTRQARPGQARSASRERDVTRVPNGVGWVVKCNDTSPFVFMI